MRFRPEHYIEAAQERRDEAWHLLNADKYAGAMYLTGAAVECLFWAYRTDAGHPFKAHHDLMDLYKESGLLDFITTRNREPMAVALVEVWSRWKNNFRYASDQRLRAEIKARRLDRGIKGDALKQNARQAWDSASYIIAMGVEAWRLKKN